MGWFGFVRREEGGEYCFFFRVFFCGWMCFFFLGVICFEGAHLEGGFDQICLV